MLSLWVVICSALWATNTQAFSYTDNVNIVDHLNSLNTTKPWFKLLHHSIYQTLKAVQQQVDIYFVKLFDKINILKRWCIPGYNEGILVIRYHMEPLAPCGFVQKELEINNYTTEWAITVPKVLYVQVYFLVFEIDGSHNGCEHSAFFMAYFDASVPDNWTIPSQWVFCGHRKPWYETAPSRRVNMLLRQTNVRQSSNITFIYTSLEGHVANVYLNHTNIYKLPLMQLNALQRVGFNRHIPTDVQNWRILAEYGFRLHVSHLRLCCSSSRVAIYDGFQEDFALRYRKEWGGENFFKHLDFYSSYYQMELHFHLYHLNYSMYQEILMITTFQRVLLPAKKAEINSVTKVHNNGNILYAAYSLGTTAKQRIYPNVSLVIRKFDGWNEGSCKFGGYLITEALHNSTDKIKYFLGPFCSKSIPTEPFVGTHGHKNLVFGRQEIYIILYAFGSLYTLDLDLVVLPSLCEGIFELPLTCLDNSILEQHTARKSDHNYQVTCFKEIRWNKNLFFRFTILSITNCIILQGMGYSGVEEERYDTLSAVNVKANVKRSPNFLPIGLNHGRSEALLTASTGDNFHATQFNKSLEVTLNNTATNKLRIISVKIYQIFAYNIQMNAIEHMDGICSDSTGGIERTGDWNGKFYQKILLVNHCGFVLFKLPDVLIFSIFAKASKAEMNYRNRSTSSYILHTVITKMQCNKRSKFRNRDRLTLNNYDDLSHSIKLTSETMHLDIYRGFGLVIEKSIACTAIKVQYRIERFRIISKSRFILVGNLQTEAYVIEVSIAIQLY